MTYQSGELDQRISLQRETRTADEMGGAAVSWVEFDEVWARVRPMSGAERERAGGLASEAMYLVVIRNRSDLTEADTIVWRGVRLNMRHVKYRPRSPFLEIEAEEGVA